MFKVEKVLDLKGSEFAQAFQELVVKYSQQSIDIGDNRRMFMQIPQSVNENITGHNMNIITKYVRSEKYLKECIEMANEYAQDQSENPSLHYIENIYEIIKLQIISSREAWEILKILIDDKVESHEELAKWCNGKYENSKEILKDFKRFYDIRGDIEHPSKSVPTTMLQKVENKIMHPTAKFKNENYNLFDLAIECLNVNFKVQRMLIDLGYYYSKYVIAMSESGSIFINKNFDFKNNTNQNHDD